MNLFCFLAKIKLASRTVGAASELRGRIWTPTHSSVASIREETTIVVFSLSSLFKKKLPKEKCL